MPPDNAALSQRERWALCDLLAELGPDAPTLCEGWRSADLAAHLVTRDRRPDAMPGMVVRAPPFGPWTDRVQRGVRDKTTWGSLLGQARSGPPALLKPLDHQLNTIEYFVHHEDLRRAQPGWAPRSLATADEAVLWHHLRYLRLMPHPSAARLEAPGQPPLVLSRKGGGTVVHGPVGELALWLMGRQNVARVEVSA
jgi:uncharacterized protein (TIGR03085 family)